MPNSKEAYSVKLSQDFQLATYPNPFTSTITLDWGKQLKEATIEIYDMTGKEVFATVIKSQVETINTFTWNPDENVSKGIYWVKLLTPEGIHTTKVLYR